MVQIALDYAQQLVWMGHNSQTARYKSVIYVHTDVRVTSMSACSSIPRHVQLAVRKDEELLQLMEIATIAGGKCSMAN